MIKKYKIFVVTVLLITLMAGAVFALSRTSETESAAPTVSSGVLAPEKLLHDYFNALGSASYLTEEQMGAVGGSMNGTEPYKTAFSYWSKSWQTNTGYDRFLASWKGTVNVELLKLLPAGEVKGQKRFFVETKNIEVSGEHPHTGIFYYTGFFTVSQGTKGWEISSGSLEPENLAWKIGGHQPWKGDAEMVAHVDIGGSIEAPLGKPVITNQGNGTATVSYMDTKNKEIHRAALVQTQDGIWHILDKK